MSVRLAYLRHTASVHPEPGSDSQRIVNEIDSKLESNHELI